MGNSFPAHDLVGLSTHLGHTESKAKMNDNPPRFMRTDPNASFEFFALLTGTGRLRRRAPKLHIKPHMRSDVRLALAVLLVAASSVCAAANQITKVSVRDARFKEIKVLDAAELAEFETHWQRRKPVEVSLTSVGGDHYKLDIEHRNSGARWLYQTTGYVTALTVKKGRPVYRIPDANAFNKLIGATEGRPATPSPPQLER